MHAIGAAVKRIGHHAHCGEAHASAKPHEKRQCAAQKHPRPLLRGFRRGGRIGVCGRLRRTVRRLRIGRLRGNGVSGRLLHGLRDGSGDCPARRLWGACGRVGLLVLRRCRMGGVVGLDAGDAICSRCAVGGLHIGHPRAASGGFGLLAVRTRLLSGFVGIGIVVVARLVHGSAPNGMFPAILARSLRDGLGC